MDYPLCWLVLLGVNTHLASQASSTSVYLFTTACVYSYTWPDRRWPSDLAAQLILLLHRSIYMLYYPYLFLAGHSYLLAASDLALTTWWLWQKIVCRSQAGYIYCCRPHRGTLSLISKFPQQTEGFRSSQQGNKNQLDRNIIFTLPMRGWLVDLNREVGNTQDAVICSVPCSSYSSAVSLLHVQTMTVTWKIITLSFTNKKIFYAR